MPSDAKKPGRVVVIGSGPGGAAAALSLSNAGIDTLVLEAGAESASLGFTARVLGLTIAKKKVPLQQRPDFTRVGDPAIELYEELAPGGLSNHWACAVPRFSEQDFLDAERAGEEYAWPLSYAELAPWYDRVEPLLNIAAGNEDSVDLPQGRARDRRALPDEWQAVARAASAIGRSLVVMPYANGATTMFTRSATAFNAFAQLILPAAREGKVSVRYDAHVQRLEWSQADKRVVAVIFRDGNTGREERIECRGVVVAAGAVNSAQILLQSTSPDFSQGLGNQHDVLGRYLHDHPLGKLVVDLGRSVTIHPAMYLTRPRLERTSPLYAAACMQWSNATYLIKSALRGAPGKDTSIGFSVFGTMVPTRDDFVALDRRSDDGGRSRVSVSLRYAPEAIQTLERARDETLQILAEAGWQPRTQVWKVEAPGNSVHYGGTCRMHASPRFGVVDSRCRVHGVPNVVVGDSSVFTTGPEKNPVLTSMTLAARAGDLLAQDLRTGAL